MNTTTDRQPPITPERLNHIRSALAVVTSDRLDSHAELDKANAQWTVHSEQYAADLLAEVDRQAGLLALALEHLAPCPPPDIAVFMKQTGSAYAKSAKFADRKGGDLAEWPADLRVREFPVDAARCVQAVA